MQTIFQKIQEYQTIIIHRHTNPDLDALGSQIGLCEALKETYPSKNIYMVGEENRFSFVGKMDTIEDQLYNDALVIICDVAVGRMVSDTRYFDAKEVIVIDHHNNPCNLSTDEKEFTKPLYVHVETNRGACAEIVGQFIRDYNLKCSKKGYTALYGGITTDTGRFQYGQELDHTLDIASFLVKNGADYNFIYKNLYVESLESRLMKNYFQSKMQITDHNVAYMINDKDVFEKFDVDTFTVSRGMVNLMAGIEGVNIWANFTYDKLTGNVLCEFRSRDIVIVNVAKKYGGGGHDNACGATLPDFSYVDQVLADFNQLMEEFKNV